MDSHTAEAFLAAMTEVDAAVHKAFTTLGPPDTPSTIDWHHRLATILALVGTGFYKPLCKEYPDICPEQMRFYLEAPDHPSDWPLGPSTRDMTVAELRERIATCGATATTVTSPEARDTLNRAKAKAEAELARRLEKSDVTH